MGFRQFLQGENVGEKPNRKLKPNNYDRYLEKKRLRLQVGGKTKNVEIARPRDFADIEVLIDKMRASDGIIVDFSALSNDLAQRMLDFLSGAVYAFLGEVLRIEDNTYLMTPKGVKIVVNVKDVE